jgi:hypothetical protein
MQIKTVALVIIVMPDRLSEIADQIASTERAREELAKRLRFNSGKIEYEETLERELVHAVAAVMVLVVAVVVDGGGRGGGDGGCGCG